MNEFQQDIQMWKARMNRREKVNYYFTYYWYHMLGVCAAVGLIVFLVVHFLVGNHVTAFTCVMVNQQTDDIRDKEIAEAFAEFCGLDVETVEVDSNYVFSYTGLELADANESSFEKFFLKWSNGELDAVVMTENFLEYCISMGGTFYDVRDFELGELEVYESGGVTGIVVSGSALESYMEDGETGTWVVVFPDTGANHDVCQTFIDYLYS